MSFNYFRYGSYIGSNTSVTQMLGRHDLRSHQLVRPFAEAISVTNKDTHTVTLIGGDYKIFLMGAGGGGANGYTSRFGGNGGFFSVEATLPGGSYEIGIGEGGKYTSSSAVNPALNSVGYVMIGGQGSYGDNQGSGSGGGGTYLKANFTLPGTVPNWNNYVAIAGGGGGCATHNFTANHGGHGFGVGGCAHSLDWPNVNINSGKNGFDGNNGTGGTYQSAGDTDQNGGSASVSGRLYGGNAYPNAGCQNGGGGGGGAGGGGGGGGGGQQRVTANRSEEGGYISTGLTVGSFGVDMIPRGGGGGGGHGNDCGASAAGGGSLLFSDYNTSWGTGQGADIPYWGSSRSTNYAPLAQHAAYNAFQEILTVTNAYISGAPSNYFDLANVNSPFNGSGWGAQTNGQAGRGMLFLMTKDTAIDWSKVQVL